MQAPDPSQTVLQSMYLDVAARTYAKLTRPLAIGLTRIGDVQSKMELAVGLFPVDAVCAFRRLVVSCLGLWTNKSHDLCMRWKHLVRRM